MLHRTVPARSGKLVAAACLVALSAWLVALPGCSGDQKAPQQEGRDGKAKSKEEDARADAGDVFVISIPLGKLPLTLDVNTKLQVTVSI
jgi:hypothetical protein